MRNLLVVVGALALAACDGMPHLGVGKYALFETSKGVVYRLDTTSGETEIIYSPDGWPTLKAKTLYYGENEKTYEYLGNGQLRELSTTEAADRLVEKYTQ